jgi:rRNA maturation RNase YbeY
MRAEINFFTDEVSFNLRDKRKIRDWIIQSVENEDYKVGVLNFIFTTDDQLLQLNQDYLNHYTLTDIITFDLSEEKGVITGDVYISVERARENSRAYKESLRKEIHRLIIHGVLHLMGHHDKTREEQAGMRASEEYYLSLPPWT